MVAIRGSFFLAAGACLARLAINPSRRLPN